jgi:hypothetical protein
MRYLALAAAFKAAYLRITFFKMFLTDAAIDPFSPKTKTATLKV